MPTLTWTGKEDALRAASLVPFRLLEPIRPLKAGPLVILRAPATTFSSRGITLKHSRPSCPIMQGGCR